MAPSRTDRRSGSGPSPDQRNAFQLDRDRILYSPAFRRLVGVTQVVSPGEGEVYHNRLTHTLKVAHVARRLAEMFLSRRREARLADEWGGISPDVVEAAALAHDLGHPPFGHIAEDELDQLVSPELCRASGKDDACEGYQRNPQSARIITELAVRRATYQGLDCRPAALTAT